MTWPLLYKKMFVPFSKNHNSDTYSPFQNWSQQDVKSVLEKLSNFNVNRSVGAIVGMTVGDSLGAPIEFISIKNKGKSYFDPHEKKYINPYNKFSVKNGQWTDDASMGLCIADSLLLCEGYDGADIRRRFWQWWFYGYNNAFRLDPNREMEGSVGLGQNISEGLYKMKREPVSPIYKPKKKSNNSGNGSLMRLAPIAIYFSKDLTLARKYGGESSLTTHPGTTAFDACSFLSFVIASAIHSEHTSIQSFLDDVVAQYLEFVVDPDLSILLEANASSNSTESFWRWRDSHIDPVQTLKNRGKKYNGYSVSDTYFFSYCLDALALSLHSLYTTNNAMDAIYKSINFLGDADSTGSITGQIAGAFYGYNDLDQEVLSWVHQWTNKEIELRGILLYQ